MPDEVFPPSEGPETPMNREKMETVGIEPTEGSRHCAPATESSIRADERERLSARVYGNGWCPTCARPAESAVPAPDLERVGDEFDPPVVPVDDEPTGFDAAGGPIFRGDEPVDDEPRNPPRDMNPLRYEGAHRRPDELIPVEEAEDAVWDVITRMNEEPAPCSGPAKRQARWLWEQSERPRVWADANGDHPILVPFPMAEQAVHVARASVVHEIVADLRAESEITGVARLAADRLADYIEQRYGATDPDVTQRRSDE